MNCAFYSLVLMMFVACESSFRVGVGISDMTGPPNEIVFMGYANPEQIGSGIHMRLMSRAFVIQSDYNSKKNKKNIQNDQLIGFVSVDGGMASDIVKFKVIERVNNVLGENVFSLSNLCISGTHTHSGAGGFIQYVIYQASTYGFVHETFAAWVNGISESLIEAYNNLEPADIFINQGNLYNSSVNRSPTSYLLNPQEEIKRYQNEGDTDNSMLLLKFMSIKDPGRVIGILNWFAVHGTSMNNTNTMVSGDNKGYASYAFEYNMNRKTSAIKSTAKKFVAAFASTNLGDVSPNTRGARCVDTGLPCQGDTSSCNNRCEKCMGTGPGKDMIESTQIIGKNQFLFADNLAKTASKKLKGNHAVDFRHSFVNMPKLEINDQDDNGSADYTGSNKSPRPQKSLCRAAFGYSFGAGTTDGPGMFDFTQGSTSTNPFWRLVTAFLSRPTAQEKRCQHPKPILLNLGDMTTPYEWVPSIMPFQVFRIGNLFIVATSTEMTTMAGRRLREAVKKHVKLSKVMDADEDVYVVIAGLANSYQSYTTTFEEYHAQRYEAASTLFGPHQLEGMMQEFVRLTQDLVSGQPSLTGPSPPDLLPVQLEFAHKPKYDSLPACHSTSNKAPAVVKNHDSSSHISSVSLHGQSHSERMGAGTDDSQVSCINFGDVVNGLNTKTSYMSNEVVTVTFYGANPRHHFAASNQSSNVALRRSPLLTIEKLYDDKAEVFNSDNSWNEAETIADEGDWSTQFEWRAVKAVQEYGGDPTTTAAAHSRSAPMSATTSASTDWRGTRSVTGMSSAVSYVTATWDLAKAKEFDLAATNTNINNVARYRICYHGYALTSPKEQGVLFTGCSSPFRLGDAPIE